jgi:hypothetical protein
MTLVAAVEALAVIHTTAVTKVDRSEPCQVCLADS